MRLVGTKMVTVANDGTYIVLISPYTIEYYEMRCRRIWTTKRNGRKLSTHNIQHSIEPKCREMPVG